MSGLAGGVVVASNRAAAGVYDDTTGPVLVDHRAELMPLLLQMLREPDPLARQVVLIRIGWFGKHSQAVLPTLEAVAKNDTHAEVRRVAADVIGDIKAAAAGATRPDTPRRPAKGDSPP